MTKPKATKPTKPPTPKAKPRYRCICGALVEFESRDVADGYVRCPACHALINAFILAGQADLP